MAKLCHYTFLTVANPEHGGFIGGGQWTPIQPNNHRQEQEPMDWADVRFLPEVSAPFVPSRPPRKMRSLISVQVSEPPSLSANRFPNMRALVPKVEGGASLHSRGCPGGRGSRVV
ncbi:hypothetical protein TNCV_2562871 [Trichonephila clavipes]|uniref:Uncharacterized protein n=1 Tax=Trichonephila clavipes TaxID=2585209 RepID=A0A8X6USV3_TRICX|nr:hypothetical protein TNCV_2562871 [Trichonephila clavipes]